MFDQDCDPSRAVVEIESLALVVGPEHPASPFNSTARLGDTQADQSLEIKLAKLGRQGIRATGRPSC